MKSWAIQLLLAVTLLVVAAPHTHADDSNPVLVGTVTKVSDGDTLKVALDSGPITVRLYGVDAPEADQPWGTQSRLELAELLMRQEVALEVISQDRYDRLVAVVYLGDGNANAWLVDQGFAWAYREYLRDPDYCYWEHDARSAQRGLWSLPPDQRYAPWEWRQWKRGRLEYVTDYSDETAEGCIAALGRRAIAAQRPESRPHAASNDSGTADGRCLIKGNISKSGHIYHVPGSPSYKGTQIDGSKGERWFCTEDEAQAAGWRPPK